MSGSKAAIVGLSTTIITEAERELFAKHRPYGFILFKRNIDNPAQVKALTLELRQLYGEQCPILIDQEGGRVARLKPPHWREFPAMQYFREIAETDLGLAKAAIYTNARLIGFELHRLGIDVDCAPVCDLLFKDAHDIIGDRSFGSDPVMVANLARQMALGLFDSKVMPILKHIPGHGRAFVDSHEDLPIVTASLAELEATDFMVFKLLSDINYKHWAMTAHIIYSAIDADKPATLSPKVIKLIREYIGFKGILISDDLSMKALKGSFEDRTKQALDAGCDLVLHCNGDINEMQKVLEASYATGAST